METQQKITIEATVNAPVEKVWNFWNEPQHIMNWNSASPDWHCPRSENHVRTGGKFSSTMAAKDGSFSFDFEGEYSDVQTHKRLAYFMADGRTVEILFEDKGDSVHIKESFDPEGTNPLEMQRAGWQAILDNFKKYTEEN